MKTGLLHKAGAASFAGACLLGCLFVSHPSLVSSLVRVGMHADISPCHIGWIQLPFPGPSLTAGPLGTHPLQAGLTHVLHRSDRIGVLPRLALWCMSNLYICIIIEVRFLEQGYSSWAC